MEVAGLSINTIVDVEYNLKNYKCSVQEITDNYIALSLPMNNGEYLIPHINEEVSVTYFDSSDIYSFSSNVVGRKRDNIPLLLISIPLKVKKVQRRNYVRVSVVILANCWNVEKNTNMQLLDKVVKNQVPIKGTILDISGGGARLLIESTAKINDLVVIEIPLEKEPLFVHGKVVRVSKDDLGREIIGLNFEDMNEPTRDKLIKFVFDVMRKQRRKV